MMFDNDETIFEYLEPFGNDMISTFNDRDLNEILLYLNKYYLEYREILEIDKDITFGIEIEFDNFRGSVFDHWPFQLEVNKTVGNDRWKTKNDITLNWGREIASDILRDNKKTWIDIKNICNLVSQYGEIDRTCAMQVHIGSQILGDNIIYWYRLLKIWKVYENIIYRFCYGEYLTHRDNILNQAKPVASFFNERLKALENSCLNGDLLSFIYFLNKDIKDVDLIKKNGISFWHMLCDSEYNLFEDYNKYNYGCTVEYRAPNGSDNEIIIQNEILFFIKLMFYCKGDNYNEEIINGRDKEVNCLYSNIWKYSNIYLEQAIELADMIYDNNIDKIYFLRQYLKNFEVADKAFVKARKFTV